MVNERADAIRAALREAVVARYGSLEAAAPELGVPYKTLYRHLTESGKDRTARVPLDFVLDVCATLGISLSDLDRHDVSADGPSVTDAMDVSEVHGADEEKQSTYGLAAKRGRRKADQPHAE